MRHFGGSSCVGKMAPVQRQEPKGSHRAQPGPPSLHQIGAIDITAARFAQMRLGKGALELMCDVENTVDARRVVEPVGWALAEVNRTIVRTMRAIEFGTGGNRRDRRIPAGQSRLGFPGIGHGELYGTLLPFRTRRLHNQINFAFIALPQNIQWTTSTQPLIW